MKNKIKINSYTNITDALYDYANKIKNNFQTDIKIKRSKSNILTDYSKELQTTIYNKAKENFSKIGKRKFENNGEIIYVSNSDIKESIAKTVRNAEQKKLITEHMEVFANLDKIIENGVKIASAYERKERNKYNNWDYYATPIKIDNKNYIIEFDTVLKENDEKHFRLQRIFKILNIIKKRDTSTGRVDNQLENRFKKYPVSIEHNNTKRF